MELFGDLSSYNAAATLRISSILKGLDEVLYKHDFSCADLNKENAVDARSRSIRNPLLLMFRPNSNAFLSECAAWNAAAVHIRPSTVPPPVKHDFDAKETVPDADITVGEHANELFSTHQKALDDICMKAWSLYSPPSEPIHAVCALRPTVPSCAAPTATCMAPADGVSSFALRGHSSSSYLAQAPRSRSSVSAPKLQRGNPRQQQQQQHQAYPRISALGAGFAGVTGTRVLLQEKGRT